MALIISDCDAMRSLSIKWPESPRIVRPSGIPPELVRLSIGIEKIDDILADMDQALGRRRDCHFDGTRHPYRNTY